MHLGLEQDFLEVWEIPPSEKPLTRNTSFAGRFLFEEIERNMTEDHEGSSDLCVCDIHDYSSLASTISITSRLLKIPCFSAEPISYSGRPLGNVLVC